jgi:hypothetical protein
VSPDWDVERELTYVVAPADTPAVHRLLAPAGGLLALGEESTEVRARPANIVLHVYTHHGWYRRRRVLIELTGRRRIRLSEKRWGLRRGEVVKLDRRQRITPTEAWDQLAGRWQVGFVKYRFPLELTHTGDGSVLLARIDVMCPVDPAGELQPHRTFTHLEIEARSDGADPAVIERAPDLWARLGPLVAPLTQAKADIADGDDPPPRWSAAETATRVQAIDTAAVTLLDHEPLAALTALHAAVEPRRK